MNIPLILYRISSWTNNLVTLFLVYTAIKCKEMWRGRYLFLALNFVYLALLELISSVTAIFNINNLFLDHLYVPIAFILKTLYLNGEHKSRKVRYVTYLIIFIFVLLQIYVAFNDAGYKKFNAEGSYGSELFFLIYSFMNLTMLFREKTYTKKLRLNPNFWFTMTIFCRAGFGLVTSILDESSYEANNDMVLFVLFTSENFIKSGLYFGYFRGIKLLR